MPQVPQYNREVGAQLTPTPYRHDRTDENTFGGGIYQAQQRMGAVIARGGDQMTHALNHFKDRYDRARLIEFSNELQKYEQDNIRNGYLKTSGKEAMSGAQAAIDEWNKNGQSTLDKFKFTGYAKARANDILLSYTSHVQENIEKHNFQQTETWNKTVFDDAYNNVFKNASFYRHDPEGFNRNLKNLNTLIDNDLRYQKLDADMKAIYKGNLETKVYEGTLDSLIAENSLAAKAFFENNKDKISAGKIDDYISKINNMENKYYADEISSKLVGLTPEEAYKQIDSIENIELKDAVERRYNHYIKRQEDAEKQVEKQQLDQFYNTALQKKQNGMPLSYDDIPQGLDSKTQLSLMEYVSKNGNPESQDDVWEELYELKVSDAQKFANLDLNKFRGYLSDGEYKQFLKDQQKIKSGGYYTDIQDDDKKIQEALKSMGLDKNETLPFKADKKDIAYSEIRSMVREFEAKKGRTINANELNDIVKSLGYKGEDGAKIYQQLELGMRTRTGFIKNVIGDFIEYQKQHNGQMPTDDEKYKIINRRVADVEIERNQSIIDEINSGVIQQQKQTQPQAQKQNDIFFGHSITSPYGKRTQPTKGASTNHQGIDLSYKMNEPVKAFEGGMVVRVGKSQGLGNFVEIQDQNGIIHSYGHNNKITVNQGQYIKRGDEIALAGSTGISIGPHVHYSKKQNGKFIDPTQKGGAIQDGTVIKNAKTGQRMVMRNGQWQAM